MKHPSERLRAYRAAHSLSLVKLGRLLDCDPSMISRIEVGSRSPGAELAAKIADVCGIPRRAWKRAVTKAEPPETIAATGTEG